ncbi:hypothetical protein J31TS3_54510 [Paenibacillus lactis]|nr:hypothetical protein J31TS3_54510 [Paenibacillus lactis]
MPPIVQTGKLWVIMENKKNVYRGTLNVDRPRLAVVFLEISGSRSFEAYTF